MKIEISKMDWGAYCKDIWSEFSGEDALLELQDTIVKELKNIISDNDKEFLSFSIFVDGEYYCEISEFLDKVLQDHPDWEMSTCYRYVCAEEAQIM